MQIMKKPYEQKSKTEKRLKWLLLLIIFTNIASCWRWEYLSKIGIIDRAFASGEKYDYHWEIEVFSAGNKYNCHAIPTKMLGMKSYLITDEKVIHGKNINGEKVSRKFPIINIESYFKP